MTSCRLLDELPGVGDMEERDCEGELMHKFCNMALPRGVKGLDGSSSVMRGMEDGSSVHLSLYLSASLRPQWPSN